MCQSEKVESHDKDYEQAGCRVTVLMALNRYDDFAKQAIKSVFEQTYQEFELILAANGTPELPKQIKRDWKDRRIKVIYSPIEQLAHNLNRGLEEAKGEYIARLDADDIALPNRLVVQLAYLDQHPECLVVSAEAEIIDEFGATIREATESQNVNHRRLWLFNPINHSAAFFRKQAIISAGGYSGIVAQDYDLWLRLERRTKSFFKILPAVLIKCRTHSLMTRGKIEGYGWAAGYLLREFMVRKDIRYLIGCLLAVMRAFLRRGKLKPSYREK
jgi:O86/O127-antigen biosynthesis beta-1,3-galactosyltransferase